MFWHFHNIWLTPHPVLVPRSTDENVSHYLFFIAIAGTSEVWRHVCQASWLSRMHARPSAQWQVFRMSMRRLGLLLESEASLWPSQLRLPAACRRNEVISSPFNLPSIRSHLSSLLISCTISSWGEFVISNLKQFMISRLYSQNYR